MYIVIGRLFFQYILIGDEKIDTFNKHEALEHAEFISYCFNNSEKIINCKK